MLALVMCMVVYESIKTSSDKQSPAVFCKMPRQNNQVCGAEMRKCTRKQNGKKVHYRRCSKRSCQKEPFIRYGNALLVYSRPAARHRVGIPFHRTHELLWYFLFSNSSIRDIVRTTKLCSATIVEWFSRDLVET